MLDILAKAGQATDIGYLLPLTLAGSFLSLLWILYDWKTNPEAYTWRVADPVPQEITKIAEGHMNHTDAKCPGSGNSAENKVVLLYEEYIHLSGLRDKWMSPMTKPAILEPSFVSAMHGIELGFLLLYDFISDERDYVVLQRRIELISKDIANQVALIADTVDIELTLMEPNGNHISASLTQHFPFEGCPPTLVSRLPSDCRDERGRQSPGLELLLSAVKASFPRLPSSDQHSLRKVVRVITGAFATCLSHWTVGVGLEEQLQELRRVVGLEEMSELCRYGSYLDYTNMVQPELCVKTMTNEQYEHSEDFFFRTVHLGTECWAFIALDRMETARESARAGRWHNAAAHLRVCGGILDYLGQHVMMLCSMMLSDYLPLKVEIEGTSGAGSTQVKKLRGSLSSLLQPLTEAALVHCGAVYTDPKGSGSDMRTPTSFAKALHPELAEYVTSLQESYDKEIKKMQTAASDEDTAALLEIYRHPDAFPELNDYAKALEDTESCLLGGFYYRHFLLACNVIGSDSRGTMNRAVLALKRSFEVPIFPLLDKVRSSLGAEEDARLKHLKGRIMNRIELQIAAKSGCLRLCEDRSLSEQKELLCAQTVRFSDRVGVGVAADRSELNAKGIVYGLVDGKTIYPRETVPSEVTANIAKRNSPGCVSDTLSLLSFEQARQELYSKKEVPTDWQDSEADKGDVLFLDHALGFTPPAALCQAVKKMFVLQQAGSNVMWQTIFSEVIPQASRRVLDMLSMDDSLSPTSVTNSSESSTSEECTIEWGHNSHELVLSLMSCKFAQDGALRILTSDGEFWSIYRQINAFLKYLPEESKHLLIVHQISVEPPETFLDRFTKKAKEEAYNFMYCSQIVFATQQNIIPDINAFSCIVQAAVKDGWVASGRGKEVELWGSRPSLAPFLIVDACHSFAAIPTSLDPSSQVFYLAGLLKHAGCGPNATFVRVPSGVTLCPILTGWLADLSVLSSGNLVKLGSEVEYQPGRSLMGSTPAFGGALLTFLEVAKRWDSGSISVSTVHDHVILLQESFVALLPEEGALSKKTLLPLQDSKIRSHTLVFRLESAQAAFAAASHLQSVGIVVDARDCLIRMGIGYNHSLADVSKAATAMHCAALLGVKSLMQISSDERMICESA